MAYVDGYNLYFGRLKRTTYKWLDVASLLRHVLRVQDPTFELQTTKFFTASILARLARLGSKSVEAQNGYHRALEQVGGVKVICGKYSLEGAYAPRYVKPADKDDRVKIWRMEEKQTDVRIALEMYRDAASGRVDQVVLVTNDSDLVPALEAIREDLPHIKIGVVFPLRPPLEDGSQSKRPPSESLRRLADWSRSHILDEELQACQLRDKVHTGKKPVIKPAHW